MKILISARDAARSLREVIEKYREITDRTVGTNSQELDCPRGVLGGLSRHPVLLSDGRRRNDFTGWRPISLVPWGDGHYVVGALEPRRSSPHGRAGNKLAALVANSIER